MPPFAITPPPDGMPQEVIDFRSRSIMPDEDVDEVWSKRPGYLEAALEGALADITARLRKRYRTPFDPKPEVVVAWQTKLVTPDAYESRGQNDQAFMEWLEKVRERAYEQIKEAADAQNGLYDLPLLESVDATGIVRGGPLGHSEPSPYDWVDAQNEALRGR